MSSASCAAGAPGCGCVTCVLVQHVESSCNLRCVWWPRGGLDVWSCGVDASLSTLAAVVAVVARLRIIHVIIVKLIHRAFVVVVVVLCGLSPVCAPCRHVSKIVASACVVAVVVVRFRSTSSATTAASGTGNRTRALSHRLANVAMTARAFWLT